MSLQKNVSTSREISNSKRDEFDWEFVKLTEDESDNASDDAVDDLAVMIKGEIMIEDEITW